MSPAPIQRNDIWYAIGGAALARYNVLARRSQIISQAGEGLRETVTRASIGTLRGRGGRLLSAAIDVPRLQYVTDPTTGLITPYWLAEESRVQLTPDPENFGAWTNDGTVTRTGGQADPFGGTAAYLIGGDGGGHGIRETIAFTSGEKSAAIFLRKGTATTQGVAIWDNTASTYRHNMTVTWTAGVPVLTTANGSGTRFPVEAWGGGWYRVGLSATGVVGANSNRYYLYPDGSGGTANVYAFGADSWNEEFPTSYQGPSLGTRSADGIMSFAHPWHPQSQWLYVKFVELGTRYGVGGTGYPGIFTIGGTVGSDPSIGVTMLEGQQGRYIVEHYEASANSYSQPALNAAYGDIVEVLGVIGADGSVTARMALNAQAEVAGSVTSAVPFGPAWAVAQMALNRNRASKGRGTGFLLAMGGPGTVIDTIAKARQVPV